MTKNSSATEGGVKTKAILLVSFGTSFPAARLAALEALEQRVQAAYPDYAHFRAYTSKFIIRKLRERDGLEIWDLNTALSQLRAQGFSEVYLQPTHLLPGEEYGKILAAAQNFAAQFSVLKIGTPLLSTEAACAALATVLAQEITPLRGSATAVVLVGHGSQYPANAVYTQIETLLKEQLGDSVNVLIGTLEANPSKEDILARLLELSPQSVFLHPLMLVAGDHAHNDIGGSEPDSWQSTFTAAGLVVNCCLKGLGEYGAVQNLYLQQLAQLLGSCSRN